jgi:c-di-GMP-related signal transduction protein
LNFSGEGILIQTAQLIPPNQPVIIIKESVQITKENVQKE